MNLVLRSSKVRIAMVSHVILLPASEAIMPSSLMEEAHLVTARGAHNVWVIYFVQFAVGTAFAETPPEVRLR